MEWWDTWFRSNYNISQYHLCTRVHTNFKSSLSNVDVLLFFQSLKAGIESIFMFLLWSLPRWLKFHAKSSSSDSLSIYYSIMDFFKRWTSCRSSRSSYSYGFTTKDVVSMGIIGTKLTHQGCVNIAKWSADGLRIITGSDDRTGVNHWLYSNSVANPMLCFSKNLGFIWIFRKLSPSSNHT